MGLTHFNPFFSGFFVQRPGGILTLNRRENDNKDRSVRSFSRSKIEKKKILDLTANEKSAAKTGQASNRVFEIEIFDQIDVCTGSHPLRVKVAVPSSHKQWV